MWFKCLKKCVPFQLSDTKETAVAHQLRSFMESRTLIFLLSLKLKSKWYIIQFPHTKKLTEGSIIQIIISGDKFWLQHVCA